jgi:hypothetical protein
MPEPAFIVEGHIEQMIVQRLCPGKPVQRLQVNGDDVEISAIVDRIETIYRILNNRYYPICVIFDRERRQDTCDTILTHVASELEKRGLDLSQFRIGVCDRTIENWILADEALLRHIYGYDGTVVFEGTQGKSALKRICEGVERYRETTVGVRLFLSADVQAIYDVSPSFRYFVHAVDFECGWMDRIVRRV